MLHLYDCLRANKAMAAWGVEARVPFLDPEFLDVAMGIDPAHKMIRRPPGRRRGRCRTKHGAGSMEKYILRKAFDGWIPDEILWRQKEQFSDGVGYSWIDSIKAYAEKEISDSVMANARFPLPAEDSRLQGSLLVPHDLRGALQEPQRHRARARRTLHRLLDTRPPSAGTPPGPRWPTLRGARWSRRT